MIRRLPGMLLMLPGLPWKLQTRPGRDPGPGRRPLGQRVPIHRISMESSCNFRGISIETPSKIIESASNLHRLHNEQDPYINTRWSDLEGPCCRSPGLNYQICNGRMDPGFPECSTAEATAGGKIAYTLAGVVWRIRARC